VSQLNAAKQNAQDAYEDEIKAAGGSAQHFDYSNASAPQTKPQPRGNQQTPPAGATMKVPGRDGKLHWSDGKNDLGVVNGG
jgi:hypothetical protein